MVPRAFAGPGIGTGAIAMVLTCVCRRQPRGREARVGDLEDAPDKSSRLSLHDLPLTSNTAATAPSYTAPTEQYQDQTQSRRSTHTCIDILISR
jgi:hypothetical protein